MFLIYLRYLQARNVPIKIPEHQGQVMSMETLATQKWVPTATVDTPQPATLRKPIPQLPAPTKTETRKQK